LNYEIDDKIKSLKRYFISHAILDKIRFYSKRAQLVLMAVAAK